jgi:hypothetical protein
MTRAGLVLATICTVAASGAEVHWSDLPKVLKGKTIDVTVKSGEVHRGKFLETLPDAIVLQEKGRVEIPRTAIVSLRREWRTRGTHLSGFNGCVGFFVLLEVAGLGTLEFPLSLAALPVTAAVEIVGLPIFAIWDSFDRQLHQESIVIRPDQAGQASQ